MSTLVSKKSVSRKGGTAIGHGVGEFGLVHTIATAFNITEYFAQSYRDTLVTSKSRGDILIDVTTFFQERNYTVEEHDLWLEGDFVFHTTDYYYHPLLCAGDDCEKEVGKRRIERQVAFSLWLKQKRRHGLKTWFDLYLLPSVFLNYRKQDREWKRDEDELQVARRACQEIVESLRRVLEDHK